MVKTGDKVTLSFSQRTFLLATYHIIKYYFLLSLFERVFVWLKIISRCRQLKSEINKII